MTGENQAEDLSSTQDRLYKYFMSVAFGEVAENSSVNIIVRFKDEIRIGISANSPQIANERLTLLEANFEKVAIISKLKLAYDQKRTNLQIFFYKSLEQMSELASSIRQGYARSAGMINIADGIEKISSSQCFSGAARKADGTISFLLVAVPEHDDTEWVRRCLLKAFLKGLGLSHIGPKGTYFGTIGREQQHNMPTAREWLLLRILYDPRMAPGLGPHVAGPVARTVIKELLKEN